MIFNAFFKKFSVFCIGRGVIPSNAQQFVLNLHSEITSGCAWVTCSGVTLDYIQQSLLVVLGWLCRDNVAWTNLATCKTNVLPTVVLLQFPKSLQIFKWINYFQIIIFLWILAIYMFFINVLKYVLLKDLSNITVCKAFALMVIS